MLTEATYFNRYSVMNYLRIYVCIFAYICSRYVAIATNNYKIFNMAICYICTYIIIIWSIYNSSVQSTEFPVIIIFTEEYKITIYSDKH